MKNYLFILILLPVNLNAQFVCDFEDCEAGEVADCNGLWTYWGCGGGPGCAIMCVEGGHTGNWGGYIPGDGTTDAVLNLGNIIFGEWGLEFWMYVPSGKEAYFNLQGEVPVGSGQWIVGNIFF